MESETIQVEYVSHEDILAVAIDLDLEIEYFEGVLNDEYIVHTNEQIIIAPKDEIYKYIILETRYATSQSNSFHVTLTNSKEVVELFRAIRVANLNLEEEY